ncbi:MAG: helix-hairpin-helix domain-containing protein [Vulcanimicrobiaceae bacterium]
MNQRLVLTAAVVALAAGAAALRPWHAPAQPALALATADPGTLALASADRPPPALATAGPSGFAVARISNRLVAQRGGAAGSGAAVVYVAGEVHQPGVYTLAAGARAVDALRAAGGPAGDADLVAVNLAEPLSDGEEIVVQPKGAANSSAALLGGVSASSGRRRRSGRHAGRRSSLRSRKEPPAETVDLNRADAAALEELPGVGPALAARIVAFRDLNGPFASLDDLLDVNGMSDSRLEEIAPYATLH